MALLLKDNSYLKIDINGKFLRYKNKTARNKEKKSCGSAEIIKKYHEILSEFTKDLVEIHYYAPEQLKLFTQWENEFTSYLDHLKSFDNTGEYPLMSEYFPDINNTIPVIISQGEVGIPKSITTLEGVYKFIKDCKCFGDINEVKDA